MNKEEILNSEKFKELFYNITNSEVYQKIFGKKQRNNMSLSNLPPGVSENDIPGNEPIAQYEEQVLDYLIDMDEKWENKLEPDNRPELFEQLLDLCFTAEEKTPEEEEKEGKCVIPPIDAARIIHTCLGQKKPSISRERANKAIITPIMDLLEDETDCFIKYNTDGFFEVMCGDQKERVYIPNGSDKLQNMIEAKSLVMQSVLRLEKKRVNE